VQVAALDRVVVAEPKGAHAGVRQRERRRATEPADADDQHARRGAAHAPASFAKYSSRLK
jgi:hypothetical protein